MRSSETNDVWMRQNSYPVAAPTHVQKEAVSFLYSVNLLYGKLVVGKSEDSLFLLP